MLGIWEFDILIGLSGVSRPSSATVTVLKESDGGVATIYEDEDGLIPLSNPFIAENASIAFYAAAEESYAIQVVAGGYTRTFENQSVSYQKEVLPLEIANGGTEAATAQGAIDNLVGGVAASGYVLRSNGTNSLMAALQASDIPSLDASKVTTGVFDLARIPHGAIEKMVPVANQAVRFALTTATVQNGDTVFQEDTQVMYFVIDEDELDNAAGYQVYSAGTAAAVEWANVLSKPTTISGYGITDAVTTSGNQNIGGVKTFNETIVGSINGQAGSVIAALTGGSYITSGGTYDGSTARTFAVDATPSNTASKVVARDANGDFAARQVTFEGITIGTAVNKASIIYTTNTARDYTIPDAGANADFVMTQGAQSISGTKTFTSTISGSVDGTATTLMTSRRIYGNYFNGSADLNQVIASTYGGTGNGFTKFTGPATSEKTFTLPNVSATLLYSGGALGTPSSGTLTNCTFPTLNQDTTGNAATATTAGSAGSAGYAATVTCVDESSDTTCYVTFVNSATGNLAVKTGSNLTFDSSIGRLTATSFAGTLSTAEQPNITSLGTLTTLTVDNININGSTITGLSNANTVLTAYAGKAIAVEGVLFDGGIVTGISSLTATTMVGNVTGNVSGSSGSCAGNAATATKSTNLIGGNNTTLLGSMPYQSDTDTTTLLAPNTTTTKKFLRQTGNGTNGAVPAWDVIEDSDISIDEFQIPYGNTGNVITHGDYLIFNYNNSLRTSNAHWWPQFSVGSTNSKWFGLYSRNYDPTSGTSVGMFLSAGTYSNTKDTGWITYDEYISSTSRNYKIGLTTGQGSSSLPPIITPMLTINSGTGIVSAAGFSGPLTGAVTGNASTATKLATARAIYGNNFDGSAALIQVIASTYGGTGNGFTKFTGPATSEKTFTLPNSSATLLYSGGALGTPSSGTLTNCTFPTLNQDTTGNAATATTAGTVTTAAQPNITSLGTLTILTVDNITINGPSIVGISDTNTIISAYPGRAISVENVLFDGGVITGISSLGLTGTRVTTGFFTDLAVTNTITGSINGNAATATVLANTRKIYGNDFNGSAALAQVIASTYGGTGNGFTKFTGPATAEKTFTLPNASATLLYSGGALGTPSSGTLTNCTFPTLNQNTTGNAATATLASNLSNGGGITAASGSRYISVDSTDSWSYISLKKSGTTIWDIAQNNGGNLEFRSAGATARATLTSAGVLTAATLTGTLTNCNIGSTTDLVIVTGASGVLTAKAAGSPGQFLAYNGAWATTPDTNTTYTASTGLTLTGTVFSHTAHTGDVTGTTALTIANKAVTLAKMNDMATASLIYRRTAGTGAPEVNTLAQLKTDLDLSEGTPDSIFNLYTPVVHIDLADTDANAIGCQGVCTDGRYVYYISNWNGSARTGLLIRVDTLDFNTVSVLNLSAINAQLKGFIGLFTDGRYIYPVPNNDGSVCGYACRVDTRDFTATGVTELNLESISSTFKGFWGGFTDGKYAYYVPHYNGSYSGVLVRVALNNFTVTGVESLSLTGVNANLKGFGGGICVGKYAYLFPYTTTGSTFVGLMCRIDTTNFTTGGVTTLDLSTVNSAFKGFVGGCSDGSYIYLAPYYNNADSSLIPRVAINNFTTSGVETFDIYAETGDTDPNGFKGAVCDGKHVYLIPYSSYSLSNAFYGKVVRVATSDFKTAAILDLTETSSDLKGFHSGCTDGKYLYLCPTYNGSYHGNTPRIPLFNGGGHSC